MFYLVFKQLYRLICFVFNPASIRFRICFSVKVNFFSIEYFINLIFYLSGRNGYSSPERLKRKQKLFLLAAAVIAFCSVPMLALVAAGRTEFGSVIQWTPKIIFALAVPPILDIVVLLLVPLLYEAYQRRKAREPELA